MKRSVRMRKILLMMVIALAAALVFAACKDKDKVMTWTAAEGSAFGELYINAVAYGGGRFVAAGDVGAMAYSTDGAKWTAVTGSAAWDYTDASRGDTYTNTAGIYAVAYGNKRFVAVGDRGKIAYSDDGAHWTAAADSAFPATYTNGDWELSYAIYGIAYGGGKWVAGGDYGYMAYSADNGAHWTAVEDSPFGGNTIFAIAYGGGKFVAGGTVGKIAYSKDGVNWTAAADNAIRQYATVNNGMWVPSIFAVAYGGGKFVAVGGLGSIAHSKDGATWTAAADSAIWEYEDTDTGNGPLSSDINGIAYGGGRFVAVSGSGKTAYSADGASWTAAADSAAWEFADILVFGGESITTADINAVAYGNKKFAAVGVGGKIAHADWK